MTRINVREFLEIAGYTSEQEMNAAIALSAHFEVTVRETPIEEARQNLERVRAAYNWFKDQRDIADIRQLFSFRTTHPSEFWVRQNRNYQMILWIAEQTVKVVESGDFKFPEHLQLDRKAAAAYYTPKCLIDVLLDEALQPLIDARAQGDQS